MKIGDRVTPKQGQYASGQPATIDKASNIVSGAWEIKFDDGNQFCYYEKDLEILYSFTTGDRVKLKNVSFTGVLMAKFTRPTLSYWEVRLDGGGTDFVYENQMELLPNQLNGASSSGQPYIYNPSMTASSTGWTTFSPSSGVSFGVDFADTHKSSSQGCNVHNWKFYQGLNERFEFCDNPGCKAKRDTDRRL